MSNKINLDELDLDAVLDSNAEFKLGSSDDLLNDNPKCKEVIQAIDDIAEKDVCRFNLRMVYNALIGENTTNVCKDGFMTFLSKDVVFGFKEFHGKIAFIVRNTHLCTFQVERRIVHIDKDDIGKMASMLFDKAMPDSPDKDYKFEDYHGLYMQHGLIHSLIDNRKYEELLRAQFSLFNRELKTALFNSKISGIIDSFNPEEIVPGDMKVFIKDLNSEDKAVYSQASYYDLGVALDAWVDNDESTDLLIITVSNHKGKKCYTFSNSEERGNIVHALKYAFNIEIE